MRITILFFSLMLTSYCFSEQDLEARGLAYEQKIRALLAEARTNDNYKVMTQNHQLFRQMNVLNVKEYIDSEFPKYLKEHPDRILAQRLDILQFWYEMRDWKYDLKNHPLFEKYSIAMPLRDPKMQAELEQKIAESKKNEEKFNREYEIQDKYESSLRDIQMVLKSRKQDAARKGNQEELKAFEEIINKQITNTSLLDIIYDRPKTMPAGDGENSSDIRFKKLQASENMIVASILPEATDLQKAEAFAQIARLYRSDTNATSIAKKSSYSEKALQCQNLPALLRCEMYLFFAEALRSQSRQLPSAVSELTERQLKSYLEGLALTLDHLKVTERVPLRGVERFDIPPGNPMRAEFEKRHAEQVAYAEYADEQNELLTFRDSFLQSIFVLCNPSAFESYDFNKRLLELGYSEEKAKAVCALLRDAAQKTVESKRIWKPSPHNIHPGPANSASLKINAVP